MRKKSKNETDNGKQFLLTVSEKTYPCQKDKNKGKEMIMGKKEKKETEVIRVRNRNDKDDKETKMMKRSF